MIINFNAFKIVKFQIHILDMANKNRIKKMIFLAILEMGLNYFISYFKVRKISRVISVKIYESLNEESQII